jgi:succinate-semialdehyde dehydrogenase/glutarate-semialdehyde dehydrogenase
MISSPLLEEFRGFVDGSWVAADSGEMLDVRNPANGELLAAVPNMGKVETDRAVAAARAAMRISSSAAERATWLSGIDHLLRENKEELGRIISLEQGKPWAEAQVEVEYAAGFFRFYAQHLEKLESHTIDEEPKNCRWTIHSRPVGVVGLITPWNFPLAMLAKKLASALAADCTAVVKPSAKTPLTMIAFFSLLEEKLALPSGKVNLLLGKAAAIGDALCQNPAVAMLSFTGSTEVGAELIRKTADQVKRLALELGGNAPFLVFADADLDNAADNLIANKFRAAGQTCVCANRVLVEASVADAFAEKVAERVARLTVGNGLDEGVDLGPLIDAAAYEKVRGFLRDALDKGASLVVGDDPGELEEGQAPFFPPVVIAGVTESMKCSRQEIFGPLVNLMPFKDDADALSKANNTNLGLAAYVFRKDNQAAAEIAAQLHFGHVGLNTGTGPTPEVPFGGMLQSGFGREGGLEGLQEFVETQSFAADLSHEK